MDPAAVAIRQGVVGRPRKRASARRAHEPVFPLAANRAATAELPVQEDHEQDQDAVERALEVIGGKWTILILRDLFTGTKRFGELLRSLEGVSPKTLSDRLKELEADGIVTRKVYPEVPPRVEYSLTEKGKSLNGIVDAMRAWGEAWCR